MRLAMTAHDTLAREPLSKRTGERLSRWRRGPRRVRGSAGRRSGRHRPAGQLADPAATSDLRLRLRCGIHLGDAGRRGNEYFGAAVNRTQRVMEAAHGGQVLLSQAAALLVSGRLPPRRSSRILGIVRLRDLGSPERIYQLVHPSLQRTFPPLHSLETRPNNLPQQLTSFVGRESELPR
jgi:hypothetical protein